MEDKQLIDFAALYAIGFGLIFIGVLILIAAIVLISITRSKTGKGNPAGAIIIGPVPIIFGSDKKDVKTLLALSVALTTLLIVAMLIYYFLLR